MQVVATRTAAATRLGVGHAAFPGSGGGLVSGPFAPLVEPDVDLDAHLRETKTRHPSTIRVLAVVEHGMGEALRAWPAAERSRLAVVLGNTSSGLLAHARMLEQGSNDGPRAVNPAEFPTTMLNYPATQLARAFALEGPNTTVSSGPSAGWDALVHAADRVASGRDPAVLVGSIDVRGPNGPSAEGIGMLLLESDEHPRGGPPLARLGGWATGVGNDDDVVSHTVDRACAAANVSPAEIDLVVGGVLDPTESWARRWGNEIDHVALRPGIGPCTVSMASLSFVAAIAAVEQGTHGGALVIERNRCGCGAAVWVAT